MSKIRDFTVETVEKIKTAIKKEKERDEWGITDTIKDWFADEVDTSDYLEDVQKYCDAVVDNKDINEEKFENILARVQYVDEAYEQQFLNIASIQCEFVNRLNRISGMVSVKAIELSMDEYSKMTKYIKDDFKQAKEKGMDAIDENDKQIKKVKLDDLTWWDQLSGKEKYTFCADFGHILLDALGMLPIYGIVADGVNCFWYACEDTAGIDRDAEMTLTALAAIPITGEVSGYSNLTITSGKVVKIVNGGVAAEKIVLSLKELEIATKTLVLAGDAATVGYDATILMTSKKNGSGDISNSSGGGKEIERNTKNANNSNYKVSEKRRKHILEGEGKNDPGHGPNRGFTEGAFPDTWTDEQVISAIEDVANSPGSTWKQSTGPGASMSPITKGKPDINAPKLTNKGTPVRFVVKGQNHGLNITVVVEPDGGGIITGYSTGK